MINRNLCFLSKNNYSNFNIFSENVQNDNSVTKTPPTDEIYDHKKFNRYTMFNRSKKSYSTESEIRQLDIRNYTSKFCNIKYYFCILELTKAKQNQLRVISFFGTFSKLSKTSYPEFK